MKVMMQRLLTRISRSIKPSTSTLLNHVSSFSTQTHSYINFSSQAHLQPHHHQRLQNQSIPGDFLKWGSLGFCRTSRFATGYEPLQPHHHQRLQNQSIPGDFLKWGSLGFCRTSRFATGYEPLQPKPLDSIIDIERAKNCSPEDLVSVWDDYHIGRGHIGASMKANLYHLLEQRAMPCRHFVIPLWRGSGYTTMFVQVQMPYIIFTGLEDYKARGTQASPYFTVTYYPEFVESKDTVLIRGDIVFTSKLSDEEARWLLETAQSFYLNDVRYKLVERFNKETREFEFKDVLQALEMPTG